jgi:hypothetical protein
MRPGQPTAPEAWVRHAPKHSRLPLQPGPRARCEAAAAPALLADRAFRWAWPFHQDSLLVARRPAVGP